MNTQLKLISIICLLLFSACAFASHGRLVHRARIKVVNDTNQTLVYIGYQSLQANNVLVIRKHRIRPGGRLIIHAKAFGQRNNIFDKVFFSTLDQHEITLFLLDELKISTRASNFQVNVGNPYFVSHFRATPYPQHKPLILQDKSARVFIASN